MDVADDDAIASNGVARGEDGASYVRRSGRVLKPRVVYAPELRSTGTAKRKRARPSNGVERSGVDQDSPENTGAESESDPDLEQLEGRKRGRASRSKKPKSALQKTSTLPLRPAKTKPRSKAQGSRPEADLPAGETRELFVDVFSSGNTVEALAAEWISGYEQNQAEAIRDVVNLCLRAAGCALEITVDDVEDPDNVTGKLGDLQTEFQAQSVTEYPLISRARSKPPFRATLTGFFHALITTAAASSLLYTDPAFMEDILLWLTSLSSSPVRPFRHTTTVILLAVESALCEVAAEATEGLATTRRLLGAEKKKSRINQARVASLQNKADDVVKRHETLEAVMLDIFQTVFVHRYRDVDPRVRVDCVQELGQWIVTMPDLFFDASYLRYFGWVLSDPYALTRLEVTKQLRALYKNRDNIGGLATFTEKFRPRLVEMATRDADPAVRAATIELLDTMRASGLLEANDINAVGRLIFDAEERVRKTVASFFVDNVNDLYELKIEELGGMEALEGILAPDPVDALDGSQIAWLKLKALAEILSSYDAEDGGDSLSYLGRGSAGAGEMLVASGAESRFTLVTQVIFDKIPEIRNWESVAGYLLFDHSDANTNTATSDLQEGKLEAAINKICRLPAVEEAVLLEVLNAAVRLRLAQPQATEGKRQRTRKAGPPEDKETAALRLAQLIPKLLNKYGAEPATASAVLRLEHVLNLEVFQQLRQDSTTYAALLDDINKQFLTHNNQTVLVEASAALLHARNFEDLQEVTDEKMQELWEDVINVFNVLARDEDIGMQGSMSVRDLRDFSDNVQRISNLAAISDCVRPLEQTSSDEVNGDTNGHNATPPLQLLLQILGRGVPTSAPSASERDWLAVEEKLVNSTMATLLFYFMWKLRALQKAISDEPAAVAGITNQLKKSHDTFASQLVRIIENRSGADALRRSATGVFLDLYTLFATLRRVATGPSSDHGESADAVSRVRTLVSVVSDEHQLLVTYVYKATEMAYAKKSGRKIEIAEEDQLADDELESDDEDADVAENELQLARARQKLSFVYEKQLCELTGKIILAIAANVLDVSGAQKGKLRERLNMNRGRLGHNFKELIVYLDKSKGKKNKKPAARARTELKQPAPEPVIVDDGDPDDGQAGDNQAVEEGGEEDLRNRELELDVGDDHGDGEEHAVSDAGADDGGVLGD